MIRRFRADRMNFEIREATPSDAETIASYNIRMAVETEGRSLAADVIGPGVAALISDAGKGRYWVAETAGKLVGQIMITYEWSDWRNGTLWWIQSVYVHPDFRRQGVYSALYRYVEAQAKASDNVRGLRLFVENDNTRARKTYEALGMKDPNYRVMEAIFETPKC